MDKCAVFLFVIVVCAGLSCPGEGFAQGPKKILSIEAYDMLNTLPDTYIIDVRTRAEYQFVGHPVSAYLFPYMFLTKTFVKEGARGRYQFNIRNRAFVDEISRVFLKTNNLIIISRDGTRSALAARDLVNAGFRNVYDVEDGFEGAAFPSFEDADKDKFYRQLARRNNIPDFNHRRHSGWQWWGLPWTYDLDPRYIYPPDRAPDAK